MLKRILRSTLFAAALLPHWFGAFRTWQGRGAILCYHRVLPRRRISGYGPNTDSFVSAERFETQMRLLREEYEPVCLNRVISSGLSRSTKPKVKRLPIAVTFDDGYADNLLYALPTLTRYEIPATIYITTGFVAGEYKPWWQPLWTALAQRHELAIQIGGEGRVFPLRSDRERVLAFRSIRTHILAAGARDYADTTQQIAAMGNACESDQDRFLTWNEVRELDRNPLITIGAHSNSHAPMRPLSEDVASAEMVMSKLRLEEIVGHQITDFAYPYGTAGEVGQKEVELARRNGFRSAVTTRCGVLDAGRAGDLADFDMPRIAIREHHSVQRLKILLNGLSGALGVQL